PERDVVGELTQGTRDRSGCRRRPGRQSRLDVLLNRDVGEERVDRVTRDRRLDVLVLQQLGAGVRPSLALEELPFRPDRVDREKREHGGEHDEREDPLLAVPLAPRKLVHVPSSFAFCAANSSSVSTPDACSSPSSLSCAIGSAGGAASGEGAAGACCCSAM